MAVFRIRPLPKGKQIGRKYRKPKLYSEHITKANYTDKEKLDMLRDAIKQTKMEQCRLKAIGGHINEADELGFKIEKMQKEANELREKIRAEKAAQAEQGVSTP